MFKARNLLIVLMMVASAGWAQTKAKPAVEPSLQTQKPTVPPVQLFTRSASLGICERLKLSTVFARSSSENAETTAFISSSSV